MVFCLEEIWLDADPVWSKTLAVVVKCFSGPHFGGSEERRKPISQTKTCTGLSGFNWIGMSSVFANRFPGLNSTGII